MIYEDFQRHINTVFRVQPENVAGLEHEFPLTLIEVEMIPHQEHIPADIVHRAPFTLLFRGDDTVLLHQGTFTLHHDQLGEQLIFIVPISHGQGVYIYQAVFS